MPKVVSCNGQIGCRTRPVHCYSWVAVRTELSALLFTLRPRTVRRTGDPLYKHWPFLLVRGEATGSCYGVLYDSMAPATFDLGCEHSNYYGRCGHRLHRVSRRYWCCTFGAVFQAFHVMSDCNLLFTGCSALSGFGRTKQRMAIWTTILFLGHASGARMPILPAYRNFLLASIRCFFPFILSTRLCMGRKQACGEPLCAADGAHGAGAALEPGLCAHSYAARRRARRTGVRAIRFDVLGSWIRDEQVGHQRHRLGAAVARSASLPLFLPAPCW